MDAGVLGGTIGGVIGVLGGVVGTYFSIKNTKGPLEKAFMIRASILMWVALALFLVSMFVLPHPQRLWLWVPYGVLLPLGIIRVNKRLAEIRAEESKNW